MWSSRGQQLERDPPDPTRLSLRELMAMQPRHVRGRLMPGQRYPTGMRPSRHRAQGLDLDSVGPYVPGDDVRWMDWRATARTGRAQMKRFVAESHIARMLIVDFRPPLSFGTATRPMAKTAALLAAQMAWEAFALQEPVGAVVLPDLLHIRPRRGRGHLLVLMKHLEDGYAAALAGGGQDQGDGDGDSLIEAIDIASASLGSGDEICVFSDFGERPPALRAKLRDLSAIRRFRAVIVEDPILHRLLQAGRYPYQTAGDAERRLALLSPSTAGRHREISADLRRALRRELMRDGWLITEAAGGGLLSAGTAR